MRKRVALPLLMSFAWASLGTSGRAQTLVSSRATAIGGTATFLPQAVPSPINDAPYYGELHEVKIQILDNGGQIEHTSRLQRMWRDSQGRTRLERFFIIPGVEPDPDSGPWPIAEINDPAAGIWLVLDKEKKIAHRGTAATTSPAIVFEPTPASSASEDLDVRIIDGVRAEGRRVNRVIPADAQNSQPRTVTTEIWTSPELQLAMSIKIHDSVNGDTNTDYRNFSRTGPAPDLFSPPAGYKIVNETGPFSITWGTPPPPESSRQAPPPPLPDGVYRIGGGVSAPVPTYMPEPKYDEKASQAKIEGTVLLQIIVGEDGRAHNIKVTRSLDPGLDQKAIEAVEQWRFRPGEKDGKPVAVIASVHVNFRLLHDR
jgi:TonB family protein